MTASLKLLAIAEQTNYRDIYRNIFPASGNIEMVELAQSAGSGLAGSVAKYHPNVILASLVHLDAADAEALVGLRRGYPGLGIIITFFFYQPGDLRLLRPLVVGAEAGTAILLNSSINPATEMADMVRAVAAGQVYIDPALTTHLFADKPPTSPEAPPKPAPKPEASNPQTTVRDDASLEVAHLIDNLRALDYDVREAAARILGERRDMRALPGLIESLRDGHCFVRVSAARALGSLGNSRAVTPLSVMLKDDDWEVRATAAWALGEIGVLRAEEALTEAMSDANMIVKRQAAESLRKLRRHSS